MEEANPDLVVKNLERVLALSNLFFLRTRPSNHWDVWVVDVGGDRVLIVTDYFPDTPADTVAQLAGMVESIRFMP